MVQLTTLVPQKTILVVQMVVQMTTLVLQLTTQLHQHSDCLNSINQKYFCNQLF